MPVGGYDPEDLDEKLSDLLDETGRDPSNWLTAEEIAAWENGESLVDLLSEEDIRELLQAERDRSSGGDAAS
ncbi:hypothetical protein [Halorussus sp. MSC15.2]|uniref:hypothetical protein n=1 Tax=Halorussus sp. MSC15.2 TaxID=2283638 RepID=UPI0013CFCAE7|nr:hypothetical protein [Halorussus sp. MSC15.2]NEU57813.1 hypothetical protein [Halorussus sp. MSC15.2]